MTDRRTLAALFAGISRSGVTMISGLDQREQSLVVGGPRQLEHGAGQRVRAAPGVAGCEGQHRPVDRVRAVGQQRLLLVYGGIVPVVARRVAPARRGNRRALGDGRPYPLSLL